MLMTPLRIVTLVRAPQPENVLSLILFRPTGSNTLTRLVQLENAPLPTVVTLLGIVTLVRAVPSNAWEPRLVTLLPIEAVVRLLQTAKAPFPTLVTLLGIVTLV